MRRHWWPRHCVSHFSGGRSHDLQQVVYGLPLNGKKLTDSVAIREAPAVVYTAPVQSCSTGRCDMECASPKRQNLLFFMSVIPLDDDFLEFTLVRLGGGRSNGHPELGAV